MNKIMHPIEPEELMAYLDGELSDDRSAVAAAHLSECLECQALVTDLRGTSHTLQAWGVSRPEPEFPPAIATVLDDYKPERVTVADAKGFTWRERLRVRWPRAEWVGALAAVFLALVGTITFMGGRTNKNEFRAVASSMSDGPSLDVAPATSTQGKQFDSLTQFANLQKSPEKLASPQRDKSGVALEPAVSGPMIIRTAQLAVITKDFDNARSAVETILKRHRGYVGELKVGGSAGSGRSLTATLRVPADQLDATMTDLKTLGRVETESQTGQDVTSQYVDLQARLANARNTEQRLTDLLRQRTGKLSDVLEVEQEVDRVRGEIEQMEAERKNMSNQVSYATVNVTIAEDYKAQLQVVPPSTWTRLSNAAIQGYQSMVDGMVSLALFLLENIPSLLFWLALLFLPARLVWKKVRRSFAA